MPARRRSVEAARFAMVPRVDVPRSAFDAPHGHKTTFDGGYLVPILVLEVLPADTIRVNMTAFCRLATPIVPVMDNLIMETFFFFVPNRLLWSNWERFMGEQLSPSDVTEFLVPYVVIPAANAVPGTVQDYFGIPSLAGGMSVQVNSLPFRAYNLIWNDWFRDEDLQNPLTVDTSDGPDVLANYALRRRGKRHDYFTSARPWPQKPGAVGDTGSLNGVKSLFIPGGAYTFPGAGVPVSGLGIDAGAAPVVGAVAVAMTGNRDESFASHYSSDARTLHLKAAAAGNYPDVRVLINDIRTAEQVQMLMERNARGGTRYSELVRAHFGVISPDARLQRPEYLGGGRSFVTVNPVAQTSASGIAGTTTVLGELAGIGTAVAQGHGFSQSFTEHGYILGLVSVRADITYQQGLHRMWSRRGRYDFYWPSLAHLGEQAVLSREIYCRGEGTKEAGTLDFSVFGYQERWSEYRSLPSRISGQFRSTVLAPLDMWHFAQEFTARPTLNDTFIEENAPIDRVLQVEGALYQQFLFDSMFDVRLVRAMPMFSIPGMGHRL